MKINTIKRGRNMSYNKLALTDAEYSAYYEALIGLVKLSYQLGDKNLQRISLEMLDFLYLNTDAEEV